ncbi:dolichyl-phosphate-mannose--protein mannosyltransferase [Corynebacterium sp. TAE3-ERU12]|uniref:dolichyl-phosphate-mannose--protein mannosyltransferase n=1 Tax=Corynebacterium sp. TAE3-ERU12 TaxID=2849491 RepID=UPI00351D4C21
MNSATATGRHRSPSRSRVPWTRFDTWVFSIFGVCALLTRFAWITHPDDHGSPVFDEKHYVPQAWQMLQSTRSVISGGIEDNPGFGLVVHPPTAKRIIAIGEWLFGYGPLGWRFMSAICGTIVVLLIMDLTRRLTAEPIAVITAGLLSVCDGVLFLGSRVGMLDIFQTLFIVAAAWALLIDQERPSGWRWWRFTAGVMLGLALCVKWSGLYYMAAFGLLTVGLDLWSRKRGLRKVALVDIPGALVHIVVVPLAMYLLSFRSWFAEETSVYRHRNGDGALANFLYYQKGVLEFHTSLTTSGGHEHPWESKPWDWLWAGRPMMYYSAESGDHKAYQMLFGTPPIWWVLVPVMLWAVWRLVRADGRFVLPVVGFIAGWVPWAIGYDRQMYFFYATAIIPFVILALAIIAADLIRWRWGLLVISGYLALVAVAFVFWLPIMTGAMIPSDSINLRMWLPKWR